MWTTVNRVGATFPYFDYDDNCAAAIEYVVDMYAPFTEDGTIISGMTVDDATCESTVLTLCGVAISEARGKIMRESLDGIGADKLVLPVFGVEEGCPVWLKDHTLRISAGPGTTNLTCVPDTGRACNLERPPFPFYPCRDAKYGREFPFAMDPVYLATESTYCVKVQVTDLPDIPSKCSKSGLKKVQFWLDYSQRFKIKAITIRTNDGKVSARSQSWRPVGTNSLKVSNLDWSREDVLALEPQICFEMKMGSSLTDLTFGGGYIFSAVFSPDLDCCPESAGGAFDKDGMPA